MMGETCVIAILLGLAYLLFTHTIEFTIRLPSLARCMF